MAAAAAAALALRLQALSCPLETPLEPDRALELLCTPSGPRLELLEWLYSRVHPVFSNKLAALRNGPEQHRLQELVALGAELLLCRDDDTALMAGTAPPEQQLEFIGDLLDAAPLPQYKGRELAEIRATRLFLKELLETPEGKAALRPLTLPPLPVLVAHDCPSPRSPLPSRPELEAALEATQRHLEVLQEQSTELGGSPGPEPPVLPALRLAGGDLAALVAAFEASELLDTQGGRRGEGETPPLSACGPLAPPVCQGLRLLTQSLGAVSQLGETAAELVGLLGGARLQEMGTRVAALQQHFGGPSSADAPSPP